MTHEVFVKPYGNDYIVQCDTLPEGYVEGDDCLLNVAKDIPEKDMGYVISHAAEEANFWIRSWSERTGKANLIKSNPINYVRINVC